MSVTRQRVRSTRWRVRTTRRREEGGTERAERRQDAERPRRAVVRRVWEKDWQKLTDRDFSIPIWFSLPAWRAESAEASEKESGSGRTAALKLKKRWKSEQQSGEISRDTEENKKKKDKRRRGLKQRENGEGRRMEAIPPPHKALTRRR